MRTLSKTSIRVELQDIADLAGTLGSPSARRGFGTIDDIVFRLANLRRRLDGKDLYRLRIDNDFLTRVDLLVALAEQVHATGRSDGPTPRSSPPLTAELKAEVTRLVDSLQHGHRARIAPRGNAATPNQGLSTPGPAPARPAFSTRQLLMIMGQILPAGTRDTYIEDWTAQLAPLPRGQQLRLALSLLAGAPMMRKELESAAREQVDDPVLP